MSDYKQTRNAAGNVVSQYSAMLSSIGGYEDLERRHQRALHKIDVLEDKIEELLAALGKVQAFVGVSLLMQSSSPYNRQVYQHEVTRTMWSQWSKQLKETRATLEKLQGEKT